MKDAPTRERILIAASQLFAQKGYFGTSTADIARAVGVRQPSIFYHFPNKASIMQELLRAGIVPSLAFAERLAREGGSPAARLYRLVRMDTFLLASAPYDFRGISVTQLDLPEFAPWGRKVRRLEAIAARIVREGCAAGELIEMDARFVIWVADALATKTITWSAVRTRRRVASHAERVAAFVLRSLLRDPGSVEALAEEARRVDGPLTDRSVALHAKPRSRPSGFGAAAAPAAP